MIRASVSLATCLGETGAPLDRKRVWGAQRGCKDTHRELRKRKPGVVSSGGAVRMVETLHPGQSVSGRAPAGKQRDPTPLNLPP